MGSVVREVCSGWAVGVAGGAQDTEVLLEPVRGRPRQAERQPAELPGGCRGPSAVPVHRAHGE